MSIVNTESATILNSMTGRTGDNVWIGLSTTTPTLAGGNFTEPLAATGYARVQLGGSSTSIMSVPDAGVTTNEEVIFFPEAESDWGTLTHFGLFRGATADTATLFVYGALTNPVTVYEHYVPMFRVEQFTMHLQ